MYLGGNLISWSSKKYLIVSRLVAEFECKALALATSKVLWITYMLQELRISLVKIPFFHYDKQECRRLGPNNTHELNILHLDLHFIREHICQKYFSVKYVSIDDQLADILNKPLF